MRPILSIVIPVYNVADYINKCVESCYNQNVPKDQYEIILVNDGSTDNSLELCEKLKEKYNDLKLISQENKGLSGARNTGLKHAVGNYVWFVDSDDWIKNNCLSDVFSHLKDDIDILWLGHDVWLNGVSTKQYIPNGIDHPVSGEVFFSEHLNNLFYIWKFIYKRDFLNKNKLLFLEGYLYEDLEFTPRALLLAETCTTLPEVCYHYLVRGGSIANNIKPRNIEHRFDILNRHANLLQQHNISNTYKKALSDVILHTIEGTVNMAARASLNLPKIAYQVIGRVKKEDIQGAYSSSTLKAIKASPKLYHKLFKTFYGAYKLLPINK
ncbi:glycosyltransferase [Tamlana crocina]|uniref:Glycosyltransferase n=1 Tax=Tamlana crocina TaxID=393006 RepID=A0ABX1D9W5_9FLAO|nr:glycosyltransferase [Tamlana crocina]NJX15159.1 glycosyltransferase [Tamlana crocina]